MADNLSLKMVLINHYEGKTVRLGNHIFINGKYTLTGQPEQVGHAIRYLSYYQAYPVGSPELEGYEFDSQKIHSEVQSSGERSSEEETILRISDDNSESGETGIRSTGDGYEHAGVSDESEAPNPFEPIPEIEINDKLQRAVLSLDPDNDNHWTKPGLPLMSAVEEALGESGFTRKDIEAASDNWNKEKAIDAILADLTQE